MSSPLSQLTHALDRLTGWAEREGRLQAERERARREFPAPPGDPDAELRFLEWFLVERESDQLGATPLAVAGEEHEPGIGDSVAGLFLIDSVDDDVAIATDLQDERRFEIDVAQRDLRAGDLLIGRLYETDDGHLPSPRIVAVRPGRAMADALRHDLARLGLQRRLQQHELEQLLLLRENRDSAPAATRPLEHLEAELDRLLRESGAELRAVEVSRALAEVDTAGAVITPLLDELAFDTDIDLQQTQQLLLGIWSAHHAGDPTALPATPAVADDAAADDTGLLGDGDIDDIDEPDDGDDDGEDDELAAVGGEAWFGDLDPLIEEYLWERGDQIAGDAPMLHLWAELQANAPVPNLDVELVTGRDLMRLFLHLYLQHAPDQRVASVARAHRAIAAFYDWLRREHELPVGDALRASEVAFVDHLPRLHAAAAALGTPGQAEVPPALLHVQNLDHRGIGLRRDGGDDCWLDLPAATLAHLREGDLLLGAFSPDGRGSGTFVGMVIALPEPAFELMG